MRSQGIEEENAARASVYSNFAFQPIKSWEDEAGRRVYRLSHYMAPSFKEIFVEVDGDLARYGIQSYQIRNMTLEQVFLTIGEQELAKEQKVNQENANEGLIHE